MLFLTDRVLLENGKSVVEPSQVESFLVQGLKPADLEVTGLTPEIERLNLLLDEPIKAFTQPPASLELDWLIPDSYKYLDVEQYLTGLLSKRSRTDDPLCKAREQRLALELRLFQERGLYPMLRTLIYVVDRLREADVVWGVGRGSSCSSYILYLIGLHCVDPVKYDVSIYDFIRDED